MVLLALFLAGPPQLAPQVDLGAVVAPQGTRLAQLDQLGPAAALDLDGDGTRDLALGAPLNHHAGSYSGSVYVLYGPLSAPYALAPEAEYATGGLRIDGLVSNELLGTGVARLGDVNGDGVEDLALSGTETAYVVFGGPHLRGTSLLDLATLDGTNGFRIGTALPGTSAFVFAPTGDVNGDGVEDLFLGLPGKDTPWSELTFLNDVRHSTCGDVDGDGDLDLLVAEGDFNTIAVLANAGDGTFPTRTSLTLQANRRLQLWDVDGDGDLDLIAAFEKLVAGGIIEGSFAIFRNQGTGAFSLLATHRVDAVGRGVEVALGDLDGDGDPDIAAINFLAQTSTPSSGTTSVVTFLNDGAGNFTRRVARQFSYHSQHVGLIDTDGDLDLDVVVATNRITTPTTPQVRIHPNDGTGDVGTGSSLVAVTNPVTLLVADVNGDGRDDLFTPRCYFPGSAGGLLPRVTIPDPERPAVTEGFLGDVDGDGAPDYLVEDSSDGFLVHPNGGDAGYDEQLRYYYNALHGRPGGGDLDGDGDFDVTVMLRNRLWIAFNRGNGSFGGAASGTAFVVFGGPGLGGSGLLDLDLLDGTDGFRLPGGACGAKLGHSASPAGDMNADGLLDIAFAAPFTAQERGELYVLYGAPALGSGGLLDPSTLTPATGLRVPGVEPGGFCRTLLGGLDLNGDGRKDLVCGGPNLEVGGVVDSGRVTVLYGGPALLSQGTLDLGALDGRRGYQIRGRAGDFLGASLAGLGDFDLDGCDDFAAAALGDDTAGASAGAVHLLLGGRRPARAQIPVLHHPGTLLLPALPGSFLGKLLTAGDWNSDGRADLFLSSPPHSPGAPNAGSVHLLFDVQRSRLSRQRL